MLVSGRFEREMRLSAEDVIDEVTVKVTKEIKQSRKKNEQRPEPKLDEMEGESSSEPSQAE